MMEKHEWRDMLTEGNVFLLEGAGLKDLLERFATLSECRCKTEEFMNGRVSSHMVTRVFAHPHYLLPTQPTHAPYAAMVSRDHKLAYLILCEGTRLVSI